MVSECFSLRRFGQCLRYDFAHSLRFMLVIFTVMASVYTLANISSALGIDVEVSRSSTIFCLFFINVTLMVLMFRDSQQVDLRQQQIMLPASKLEKFASRIVLYGIGLTLAVAAFALFVEYMRSVFSAEGTDYVYALLGRNPDEGVMEFRYRTTGSVDLLSYTILSFSFLFVGIYASVTYGSRGIWYMILMIFLPAFIFGIYFGFIMGEKLQTDLPTMAAVLPYVIVALMVHLSLMHYGVTSIREKRRLFHPVLTILYAIVAVAPLLATPFVSVDASAESILYTCVVPLEVVSALMLLYASYLRYSNFQCVKK